MYKKHLQTYVFLMLLNALLCDHPRLRDDAAQLGLWIIHNFRPFLAGRTEFSQFATYAIQLGD